MIHPLYLVEYIRASVTGAGILSRDKQSSPAIFTVGCNYFSLPEMPASGANVPIFAGIYWGYLEQRNPTISITLCLKSQFGNQIWWSIEAVILVVRTTKWNIIGRLTATLSIKTNKISNRGTLKSAITTNIQTSMTCIINIRDKILYHELLCLSCTRTLFLLECHIWKESQTPKIINRISIIHSLAKNILIIGLYTTKIIKHDRWRQKSWSTLFQAITVVYSTPSHHLNYNNVLLKTGLLGTNSLKVASKCKHFPSRYCRLQNGDHFVPAWIFKHQ